MKKRIVFLALAVVFLFAACGQAEKRPSVNITYGETTTEVNLETLQNLTAVEFTTEQSEASAPAEKHTHKGYLLSDVLKSLEIDVSKVSQLIVTTIDGTEKTYTNEQLNAAEKLYLVYETDGAGLTAKIDEKDVQVFSIVARNEVFKTNWAEKIEQITVR